MTQTISFKDLDLDLPLILGEAKRIVLQDQNLEIAEESTGMDHEGNDFISFRAKTIAKKSTMEKVTQVARTLLGGQRDVIVVLRGKKEDFTIEIAAGKMAENLLASGLTGIVLIGPLGVVLAPASFGFSYKYERDLKNKLEVAVETLARAKDRFASDA
ncbi:MAG: hypothetical protein ACFFGZ_19270 [Candidatus Thorarchaeota archaeon]